MDFVPFELSYADFGSWIKVQQAYMEYAFGENVIYAGCHSETGYVYIMLENSIVISCAFGQNVEYFKSFEDMISGDDEYSFESYSFLLNQ